jgi:ethanolamine utilization protein
VDRKELIDEIVARVAAKLAQCEDGETVEQICAGSTRPGLLILTPEHGDDCHVKLESQRLGEHYQTICALMQDYQVDMDSCEAVILYCLSNEVLGKLSSGNCDTPYTRLALQAILSGKKIYVPMEQVELYRYAKTAPAPYYAMLQEKLALLEASGVVICPQDELESYILNEKSAPTSRQENAPKPAAAPKEYRLTKRVITERDVSEACTAKATCIRIQANSIVTDLAKEFARSRDISLIRE